MQEESTQFHSDALTLSGSFFWPDDAGTDEPRPLVIACSGFTGLCRIHPARFARYLTARGHACFGFDYRGFADSDGPRGRVILDEQVRDIRAATAFAAGDRRIDADRIILLGWGMGAGLVIDAARELPGVIGLVAANGFYHGAQVQQHHRGADGLAAFRDLLRRHRDAHARTGAVAEMDAFDLYPLDAQSRRYVDDVLRKTPGYQGENYTYDLGDSLLRWNVLASCAALDLPLLIAHGDRNALHPIEQAEALRDAWSGACELFWLQGAGHTEFMDDADPKFQALADRIERWVRELFSPTS